MVGDSPTDIQAAKNAQAVLQDVTIKSAAANYGPFAKKCF